MATSSDDSMELEAKTITPPRHSHHKARRRKRIAARMLLILALAIGVLAVSDFAYHAYDKANEVNLSSYNMNKIDNPISTNDESLHDTDKVDKPSDTYDDFLRRDAAAALVAAAFLITSTVISRRRKSQVRIL